MDLDKCKVIAVFGDVNSGKTNLALHLLRSYPGKRKIYTLGYPIQLDNYTALATIREMFQINDGIIFIDELHRFFKLYNKDTSRDFMELASLSAHNNNTIIFTTQLSQNITKPMEAFIDGFCITRIQDLSTLKLGSRTRKVVKDSVDIRKTNEGLFLNQGEYLSSSSYDEIGEGGVKKFPFQGIGKDWRIAEKAVAESSQELPRVTERVADKVADRVAEPGDIERDIEREKYKESPKELPRVTEKELRLQGVKSVGVVESDNNEHFQGKNNQNMQEFE